MLANKVIQFVLAAAVVWRESDAGTSTAVKLCGRQLSEIMSRVCHAYNSPSWDVPTVVEQPGTVARRKRQLGIVDECCVIGCTWEQLSEYCSISAYSESPFEDLETHNIADRSAEVGAKSVKPEAPVGQAAPSVPAEMKERERRREVGRARARGYGRGRRARCWCRRKRRTGRRRNTIMGTRKKCSRCPGGGHRISSNNMGQNSQH